LALSLAAATLLGPATVIARGGGWPWLETVALGSALILNLAVGLWLVPRFAAQGAAISTGVAYALSAAWLLAVLHRRLGVDSGRWAWSLTVPRFAWPAAVAAAMWGLTTRWVLASRADAIRVLAAQLVGFALLLALVSLWTGDTQSVWQRVRAAAQAYRTPTIPGARP
jgi:peptidoglycan biosynthesis protein MviN/MurJ (putative lipid II flippase)